MSPRARPRREPTPTPRPPRRRERALARGLFGGRRDRDAGSDSRAPADGRGDPDGRGDRDARDVDADGRRARRAPGRARPRAPGWQPGAPVEPAPPAVGGGRPRGLRVAVDRRGTAPRRRPGGRPPADGWVDPPPRRSPGLAGTEAAGGSFLAREAAGFVTPAYEAYTAPIALPAPVRTYDDPALAWPRDPTVRWRLPRAVGDRLATAPAFAVTASSATRRGGAVVVRLAVRNDGSRDGEFLARVRRGGGSSDLWSTLRFGVPAGADRVLEATPRSVADAAVGATLDVRDTGGEATPTVGG